MENTNEQQELHWLKATAPDGTYSYETFTGAAPAGSKCCLRKVLWQRRAIRQLTWEAVSALELHMNETTDLIEYLNNVVAGFLICASSE